MFCHPGETIEVEINSLIRFVTDSKRTSVFFGTPEDFSISLQVMESGYFVDTCGFKFIIKTYL